MCSAVDLILRASTNLGFNCSREIQHAVSRCHDASPHDMSNNTGTKTGSTIRTAPSRRLTERRVLVTGGAGFIGSHLCDRLLERGDEVLCVDNFYTGTRHNVHHLLSHPRFELMRHDVCFPLYVEVDQIFNLACPASPVHYQFDPVQTTKVSVHGAIHMLGLAKRVKAKILQASTSEVYGDPSVHPQKEDYWGNVNPTGLRSCYDEGKRCAETLFFDYRRQHRLPIKVARIFNTYGPGMHPNDGRVVSNFVMQALRDEDITIYGEGNQTRSFCYVDDLVDGLMRLMETPDDVTGPVNLGNPVEFTIRQLAETVISLTASSSNVVHRPLPEDDPRQRCPDISLANELLGWAPRVQLRDGLAKTIEYFDRLLGSDAEHERSPVRVASLGR
jgi:UDP-glucuronate decarboxylase